MFPAMPAARPAQKMELDEDGQRPLRLTIREDGSLSNARAERLALFLSDDVPRAQAWRNLGGKDKGGSAQYLRKLVADDVFKLRMEALMQENADILASDPIFGESARNARQLWRMARAEGDNALAQKAAEMQMKIATAIAGRAGADPPGDLPGKVPGKVGKPAAEVVEAKQPSQIKALLASMPGLTPPGPPPEEEDDGEDDIDIEDIGSAADAA